MFFTTEIEIETAAEVDMEFLDRLQQDAAVLGYIHDPVFYFAPYGAGFLLGAVFQIVAPTSSEAIVSGMRSYTDLLEYRIPEENPFDHLLYYATYREWQEEPISENREEAEGEAASEDQ